MLQENSSLVSLLQEKSLPCAQQYRSAVVKLYDYLFKISPVTFNSYGGKTVVPSENAKFVAQKLGDVDSALKDYSEDLDRLFPVLNGIHRDITEVLENSKPEDGTILAIIN